MENKKMLQDETMANVSGLLRTKRHFQPTDQLGTSGQIKRSSVQKET